MSPGGQFFMSPDSTPSNRRVGATISADLGGESCLCDLPGVTSANEENDYVGVNRSLEPLGSSMLTLCIVDNRPVEATLAYLLPQHRVRSAIIG